MNPGKLRFSKILRFTCLGLLLVLLSIPLIANGQTAWAERKINYAGQDFWLTLHKHSSSAAYHEFTITGANDAHLSFTYTATGTTQNYFLQANSVLRIAISAADYQMFCGTGVESVDNASLHIVADTDIVVQFATWGSHTDDGMVLFPTDNQNFGDEYYLNGAHHTGGVGTASESGSFSLVASCDGLQLEVTPSQATATHPAGVPFNLSLDRGQTYIMAFRNSNTIRDLSGTRVKVLQSSCCNPLNVFLTYGNTYMFWPLPANGTAPGCCADQMIEQVLPVNVWDTLYPVLPFVNNSYDNIKIVSASGSNMISFDGVPVKMLNQGGAFDTMIRNPTIISSSAPVSITQYMVSQSEFSHPSIPTPVDSFSDPAALWILSPRDGLRETYFRTVGQTYWSGPLLQNYFEMQALTLISKAANVGTIMMDNLNLAPQFLPFPGNPDYMFAYIRPDTNGWHHLVSAEPISAYYYAAAIQASIAYPLGDMRVSPFVKAPVTTLDTIRVCVGDTAVLSAGSADTYAWSNGAHTEQIKTGNPGLYYVSKYASGSCLGETRLFQVVAQPYEETLSTDTLYKCRQETIMLSADPQASSIFWSDGSTGNQISAIQYGAYQATETFRQSCQQNLHRFIVLPQVSTPPTINLGPDTVICDGDKITLQGPGPYTFWSSGVTANSISIDKPGSYWAEVMDSCQMTRASDTILIEPSTCPERFCTLVFPTAFSPNSDGKNDLFHPVYYGAITGYFFSVYNRWGEQVYQTYKVDQGWDGIYKGESADIGVYYYLCYYECPLRGNITVKGDVMLVR